MIFKFNLKTSFSSSSSSFLAKVSSLVSWYLHRRSQQPMFSIFDMVFQDSMNNKNDVKSFRYNSLLSKNHWNISPKFGEKMFVDFLFHLCLMLNKFISSPGSFDFDVQNHCILWIKCEFFKLIISCNMDIGLKFRSLFS